MALAPLSRRALGALCLALLVPVPVACGGDDDTADPPASCTERMVELMNSTDMVEAARAGAEELPADLEGEMEELDAACGDQLDALSEAEMGALVAQIDPEVAQYLGESAEQSFTETGKAIGDAEG